jgi:hypothetical protein
MNPSIQTSRRYFTNLAVGSILAAALAQHQVIAQFLSMQTGSFMRFSEDGAAIYLALGPGPEVRFEIDAATKIAGPGGKAITLEEAKALFKRRDRVTIALTPESKAAASIILRE